MDEMRVEIDSENEEEEEVKPENLTEDTEPDANTGANGRDYSKPE